MTGGRKQASLLGNGIAKRARLAGGIASVCHTWEKTMAPLLPLPPSVVSGVWLTLAHYMFAAHSAGREYFLWGHFHVTPATYLVLFALHLPALHCPWLHGSGRGV